ncbi:hypothetical protein ABZ380_19470, partial [Streptomyces sp. NPDC005901]
MGPHGARRDVQALRDLPVGAACGQPHENSEFATGDFNGDGKRDLVVNDVPSDDPD